MGTKALLVTVLVIATSSTVVGRASSSPAVQERCSEPSLRVARAAVLARALGEGRDVLGERLLRSSSGPTFAAVRRLIPPLWYARGPGGTSPTSSGAHYLPFGYPKSLYGEKAFALHVADGSEIVTRRASGPRLALYVNDGHERFGACLARLGQPRLAQGYLPILQTAYVDDQGVGYRQESFAGRVPDVRSLVSFVRLTVETGSPNRFAIVRFTFSPGSRGRLAFATGGRLRPGELRYRVRGATVLYVAWIHRPIGTELMVDEATYRRARSNVRSFWNAELAGGAVFEVPDRRVMNAQRNLLLQQRLLTWRYSIGNTYEELSFAEALDAAQVMDEYGFGDVAGAILRFAARRLPSRYSNWRAGAFLVASASHAGLVDPTLAGQDERALEGVLARLEGQILRPHGSGLLDREPFSSDIGRHVMGLHGQAVAWQGLRTMGRAWARAGRPRLATRATRAAAHLRRALRSAVRRSKISLPDGSLFVPAALLDRAHPFDLLPVTRDGSYWNLVMPYALASGLFDAKGLEARGIWRYMENHGSLLLGLVRARADRLYRGSSPRLSGIDQVYGLNLARFFADADLADRLVLSLYGTLGAALTPSTFVGGEAATVLPFGVSRRGAMYLPPNGGTNTTFLEILRLTLVHQTRGARATPTGLELAFATPRGWLADGQAIRVGGAPTSFGAVSYTIERHGSTVTASVEAPPTPRLRLRLRLPRRVCLDRVSIGGKVTRFDVPSGTIELPHTGRELHVSAQIRGCRSS